MSESEKHDWPAADPYGLKPCPKPVRAKRTRAPLRNRKPMKRTKMRCGAGSKRRKGSSFPGVRDPKYTRWLVTQGCLLAQRMTRKPLSTHDWIPWGGWYIHVCWGRIDPAHVGKHRSKGAPDFGHTVPLCRAAHAFYDEHRSEWKSVTQFSEHKMASAGSGYALKYCEQGGSSTPQGAT